MPTRQSKWSRRNNRVIDLLIWAADAKRSRTSLINNSADYMHYLAYICSEFIEI